jgi:phosphatidylserine/phosphatidylglycerophosphate/cardiolipin synthase-like enzyme
MIKFLTTNGLSAAIEDLIKNSKERLYLISPYIQLSPILKREIQRLDASIPPVNIKVVCRKEEKMNINPEDLEFLQKLKNINILSLESLHAKCYSNEKTAIVSSMNLLDVSQQKNWEMGFKIDNETDPDVFQEVKKYVEDIWNEGTQFQYSIKKIDNKSAIQKKSYSTSKFTTKPTSQQIPNKGYCIRCRAEIPLNPYKPLCLKCYPIWVKTSDKTNPENNCHICGKESKQSVAKPVCISCYTKLYK